MDREEAVQRLLDAAEALFYARGVQAVGIDEVRSTAGVSLTRLYRLYPSKQHLVAAYLRRRDERWRADLAGHVAAQTAGPAAGPADRLLAVFDWLEGWFRGPDFHGCAFINAFGELGAADDLIAGVVREHKSLFRDYLAGLAGDLAADDPAIVDQILLLAEGAMTTAAITGGPEIAHRARAAAATLLGTSLTDAPARGER
ncbi:TetR/AcrR family transcriptional regulator [Actinomadura sp. HBU206391]|uniref:TetR/AcrR family transcriptional regulator n=1 Tax=Actinomadura sp. HBU206391 TaxID=2731692 RepID=UPI0016501666|nr:TetR/AcrR family transcriptional regulator [Actinomadura sp. HBU206391]MBC6457865.1 TetR/AcrR family transcriptional regulator [Actinomadura sp. HBU206391]